MKRHPRYFILGYGHEDVRPLPKVSDDMIDQLYEKIIPYDGKHNEFGGTRREYVAKIIELFGGMIGSGNDDMDDDDAEDAIEKIIDNFDNLLKQRDANQRDALAIAYGPSGVSSKIGEFHETFVKENVLDKFAEKGKLEDVTQFGDYTSGIGKNIGAITDFGALKKNGKTALFEVKSSLEAQPTKFVVAARTLDDDNFSKEYNILFTDTADNTVKKLDIVKLIKDMPDRPTPSADMFNKQFVPKKNKVNRLEMDGRTMSEWTKDGDDIMKWMQDQGYGSITTKKSGAKMFKFNQDNAVVKKNIGTVYKEKYVDPSQARPMSSAAPSFTPTYDRSASMAVPPAAAAATDVDEREKMIKEKKMEKSLKAKVASVPVPAPAPAPVPAAPIETKAQKKARLAAIEEAKKAEAAAIEEKKKTERERSKQMAAESEAKKKAKDAEDAKKKAEETAKKAQTTPKKSKDTKKKQKPVDDEFDELNAIAAENEKIKLKLAEDILDKIKTIKQKLTETGTKQNTLVTFLTDRGLQGDYDLYTNTMLGKIIQEETKTIKDKLNKIENIKSVVDSIVASAPTAAKNDISRLIEASEISMDRVNTWLSIVEKILSRFDKFSTKTMNDVNTLDTLAKDVAKEVAKKCEELIKPFKDMYKDVSKLKTYNPNKFSGKNKVVVEDYNTKVNDITSIITEKYEEMREASPYNLFVYYKEAGIEAYIKELYSQALLKLREPSVEGFINTTKKELMNEANSVYKNTYVAIKPKIDRSVDELNQTAKTIESL
jgi:hypothetical protein